MIDGSCTCAYGWSGTACNIPCAGGVITPCSLHGICRFDGLCECDRGWTGVNCSIECDGAASNPGHFPCNLHGSCAGWFVDPRTQYDDGPVERSEALFYSVARGVTIYDQGTALALNGTCRCSYGFRNPETYADCSITCPGDYVSFVLELGECYNNGVCNGTGGCACYDGYRNFSCDTECQGGHKIDRYTGTLYSNECTAQLVCDVYPDFIITTISGSAVKCRDQDPYSDAYSKDYKASPAGEYLRVYNGLCQFETLTPREVTRSYPVPECPTSDWCNASLHVAGQGGFCLFDGTQCVEHLTRRKNYTGQPWSNTVDVFDPLLGPAPDGCPYTACQQIKNYSVSMGYPESDHRFQWHGPLPDLAPHHSTGMGSCYCLPGFRGRNCSLTCPGAVYSDKNLVGIIRKFPTTLSRRPSDADIYGLDTVRGWDTTGDSIPDGVAGRALIDVCSGNGLCEEDATCSCFLTDLGPHTNYTQVSGWRGPSCDIPCEGGVYSICSRHGVCDEIGNCTCFKGYRNVSCSIECQGVRDCDPFRGCEGVCNYAGVCLDDGSCICDAVYRGPGCELICPPWDGILARVCSGQSRGRCDENARCICSPFYEGEYCERIAGWVIFILVLMFLVLIFAAVHIIRRYLHSRLRQKRRARRERRKVKRTQAAVGRLRNYTVAAPDAASLESKGIS